MTADQRFIAIGIYINSALYLAGAFIAGLLLQNAWAWKLALVSAGISYIGYSLQVEKAPYRFSVLAVAVSILFGALSGLSLLW